MLAFCNSERGARELLFESHCNILSVLEDLSILSAVVRSISSRVDQSKPGMLTCIATAREDS